MVVASAGKNRSTHLHPSGMLRDGNKQPRERVKAQGLPAQQACDGQRSTRTCTQVVCLVTASKSSASRRTASTAQEPRAAAAAPPAAAPPGPGLAGRLRGAPPPAAAVLALAPSGRSAGACGAGGGCLARAMSAGRSQKAGYVAGTAWVGAEAAVPAAGLPAASSRQLYDWRLLTSLDERKQHPETVTNKCTKRIKKSADRQLYKTRLQAAVATCTTDARCPASKKQAALLSNYVHPKNCIKKARGR